MAIFSMSLMKYFRSKTCSKNPVVGSAGNTNAKEMILVQDKVFQNPVILQVILKHLLQERKSINENEELEQTLCIQSAKELRLVSKAWLSEINLLFRKCGKPLIFLNTEDFHEFLATASKETTNWIPPLSLSLSLVTFSFNCISWPRAINRVEMNTPLSLATLVLQRSDILEEMRVLKLNVITKNDILEKEDLAILSSCLKQGSSTLEELELVIPFSIYFQNKDLQVDLNFPRMTNLKKMKIHGKIWRLDNKSMEDDLEERLPKLKKLEIQLISGDTFFSEWCSNSMFWNVRRLDLLLLTDFDYRPVRFSKKNVQQILRSFPRLVHLQLGLMDSRELDGLRYLFRQMGRQLTSLQLIMGGEVLSEDEITGLFIGAGPEMVRRLKEDSALWGRFLDGDLGKEGICRNSIRDLKSLKTLCLGGEIVKNGGQGAGEALKNLISDLVFELGFMQLPALDDLVLKGSFEVSEEMVNKWGKQGKGGGSVLRDKPDGESGRIVNCCAILILLYLAAVVVICIVLFMRWLMGCLGYE